MSTEKKVCSGCGRNLTSDLEMCGDCARLEGIELPLKELSLVIQAVNQVTCTAQTFHSSGREMPVQLGRTIEALRLKCRELDFELFVRQTERR